MANPLSWELYITSDPEFLSNGFRVNIEFFFGHALEHIPS